MDATHQRLEELHRRLMREVKCDRDGLTKDLESAVDNLGVYTQEILTNATERASPKENALSAACRLGKPRTVCQLLHLQAIPTLKVYRSLMANRHPESRPFIASQLLMFTKPNERLCVLWMACIFDEVGIATICLKNPDIQSNVAMSLDAATARRDSWTFAEAPLPIQYAANLSYKELVLLLERYHDYDKHAGNNSYVDYLLIAAYKGHRNLAETILDKRGATVEQYAMIYEILGASEIIANNPAVGKSQWKTAIVHLESVGGFKSRIASDILCLEPTIQAFRTPQEIDAMRAKELRIQALSVMRRFFGDNYLFADALLKREYSIRISVFTLEFLLNQDMMSAANLKKVQATFEKLGFFKFPEIDPVMKCLQWCVQFVGQLRELLEVQPLCLADLDRFGALVDFTCRILFCVELIDDHHEGRDGLLGVDVSHLLRKTVAVFQPLNHHCCLLDRLHSSRRDRIGTRQIFKILHNAGADLVVSDSTGNVVCDYATEIDQESLSASWEE